MATHSSVLAWRIPGTGELGGLLSLGSHRAGHDLSDLAAAAAAAAAAAELSMGCTLGCHSNLSTHYNFTHFAFDKVSPASLYYFRI